MDFLRPSAPAMSNQVIDHSQFPLNVSSYFKRPAKIVKPNSRGDSPKNLSRRKTTASHTLNRRRTPGLAAARHGGHAAMAARPISWHPNTMSREVNDAWSRLQPFPDSAYSMQAPVYPFTTQVNGLITPLSQPSSGDSCYDETFTNLDDVSMSNTCSPCPYPAPINYESLWSTPNLSYLQQINTQSLDFSHIYQRLRPAEQQYIPSYLSTNTAPPTPDITPAMNHNVYTEDKTGEEFGLLAEPEGEVLIGMGLYDGPLSPPSNSGRAFMTLPHRASAGKGLILEETFEPSTEEDKDGEGDEDEEEEEMEEEEESVQPTAHQMAQDTKPIQSQQINPPPVQTVADVQPLSARSFFFDNDLEDSGVQNLNAYFGNPVWNGGITGQTWI